MNQLWYNNFNVILENPMDIFPSNNCIGHITRQSIYKELSELSQLPESSELSDLSGLSTLSKNITIIRFINIIE